MYKLIKGGIYGVQDYSLDNESDVDLLPKRGLATTSSAMLCRGGDVRIWFFTRNIDPITGKEIDGQWDEC